MRTYTTSRHGPINSVEVRPCSWMVAWSRARVWAAARIFMGGWEGRGGLLLNMQETTRFFIVPGLGNSGPNHWQTQFEQSSPAFTRIVQREWDAPDCQEWVATLDSTLVGEDLSNVVLIAHSLGCVAVAGIYGAITASPKILWVQAVPALLAGAALLWV